MRVRRRSRAFTQGSHPSREEEATVLDVVFLVGIIALVALIAAVGKGVERL
jgi:hypothetical protein